MKTRENMVFNADIETTANLIILGWHNQGIKWLELKNGRFEPTNKFWVVASDKPSTLFDISSDNVHRLLCYQLANSEVYEVPETVMQAASGQPPIERIREYQAISRYENVFTEDLNEEIRLGWQLVDGSFHAFTDDDEARRLVYAVLLVRWREAEGESADERR